MPVYNRQMRELKMLKFEVYHLFVFSVIADGVPVRFLVGAQSSRGLPRHHDSIPGCLVSGSACYCHPYLSATVPGSEPDTSSLRLPGCPAR